MRKCEPGSMHGTHSWRANEQLTSSTRHALKRSLRYLIDWTPTRTSDGEAKARQPWRPVPSEGASPRHTYISFYAPAGIPHTDGGGPPAGECGCKPPRQGPAGRSRDRQLRFAVHHALARRRHYGPDAASVRNRAHDRRTKCLCVGYAVLGARTSIRDGLAEARSGHYPTYNHSVLGPRRHLAYRRRRPRRPAEAVTSPPAEVVQFRSRDRRP